MIKKGDVQGGGGYNQFTYNGHAYYGKLIALSPDGTEAILDVNNGGLNGWFRVIENAIASYPEVIEAVSSIPDGFKKV